jgi:hypothetical protein
MTKPPWILNLTRFKVRSDIKDIADVSNSYRESLVTPCYVAKEPDQGARFLMLLYFSEKPLGTQSSGIILEASLYDSFLNQDVDLKSDFRFYLPVLDGDRKVIGYRELS